MAKFVLGGIVTNIAGSVGGTTLRRVPNGFSMYNKIKGTGLSKLLANTRVPQIANIFQRWALLDESVRAGWNAQALLVTFPDKFGTPKNLTGRQLFTKANIQLLPTDAFIDDSTGFTATTAVFSLSSFTTDASVPTYSIALEGSDTLDRLMFSFEVSNKQIYQPTFKSRKVIREVPFGAGTNNINVVTELLAEYPYLTAGMWVAVYAQCVNSFGMLSPYQYLIVQVQP